MLGMLPLQALLRRSGRDAMRGSLRVIAAQRIDGARRLHAPRCRVIARRPPTAAAHRDQQRTALRFTPSTRPLATAAIPVDENDVPILGAATRARELAPELYRRLFEQGEPFVVFDDVLGNDVRGAMLEDALALRRRDRFGPSQSVGSDGVPFDKEAVLSCEVEPTDFDDAPHLLAFTRDWLLTLPPALNALLGAERVSPREYGTKLAVQMASGRYPRHVDNACVDGSGPRDKRWITCIYYLQEPGWDAGGALRIYVDGDDAQGEGVDVAPTGDRLVCFFADRIVHEVLPANADRWALTLWFVGTGNDAECAADRAGAGLRAAHFPPG